MERGEERPGLHLEGAAGDLRDAIGDGDAVARLQLQGPQDQQAQGALDQVARPAHARLLSVINIGDLYHSR